MFNASGNDLPHFVHLNLFDYLKQHLLLYPSKEQDLYSHMYIIHGFYCTNENAMALWLWPNIKQWVFPVNGCSSLCVTLQGARVGMSAWLGHWWDWIFTAFLLAVALCYFRFSVPDLVLSTDGSILHSFLLPTDTPPFHFPLQSFFIFYCYILQQQQLFSSTPATLLLPVPSFFRSGVLTLISLLIPSYTHFFVPCAYPWNVGPTSLFSCACLTGEGSLSRYVPGAQVIWKI